MTTQALATILKKVSHDPPEALSAWQINNFLRTEFSQVRYTIALPKKGGGSFEWSLCRLDKLLGHFVAESPNFATAMQLAVESAGAAPLGAIVYLDEVVPGNMLRPDNKRRFWSFYLSFAEFGPARLCHAEYWLPIAVLRSSVAACVEGGVSQCMRQLLRGILLEPCGLGGVGMSLALPTPKLVRLQIRTLVGDESALKATWDSKGAAGVRPCFFCANVVTRRSGLDIGAGGPLVDVGCEDPGRFEALSDEAVWATFDRLAAEHGRSNARDFAILERASGPTRPLPSFPDTTSHGNQGS